MLPLLRLTEFYNFLGAMVKTTAISFLKAVTPYGLAILSKMITSKILLMLWSCPMVLFNILSGRNLNISRMYLKMFRKKLFGSC